MPLLKRPILLTSVATRPRREKSPFSMGSGQKCLIRRTHQTFHQSRPRISCLARWPLATLPSPQASTIRSPWAPGAPVARAPKLLAQLTLPLTDGVVQRDDSVRTWFLVVAHPRANH